MDSVNIPKQYRHEHFSSVSTCPINHKLSAVNGMFYCWPAFDGCVYYVAIPMSGQTSRPTIKMYVNGSLYDTQTPSKTYAGDGYVYEALFTGLSYGDTYYITHNFGDGEMSINTRKYIGCRGSAPTITETDSSINATMSSPYNKSYSMALGVIDFDSDYGSLNSYSREARTLLYISCLQYTEYNAVLGKVGNLMSFWTDQYDSSTGTWGSPSAYTTEATIGKFPSWESDIKVGFTSASKSKSYYSLFSSYVNNWISDINTLLGYTLFVRDDSITEDETGIRITLGTHSQLWGYNPDTQQDETTVYYGSWECTRWYPSSREISHCEVKLCNELRGAMSTSSAFKNITYEELTECLGCGNDTYHTYESMFSEIWYIGKTNKLLSGGRATTDGEVVQMLYNELDSGEVASEVIHKLTPSQGAIIQLPNNKFGVRGNGYSIRPYSMNRQVSYDSDGYWNWDSSNNCYSDIGYSYDITPFVRPSKFYWTYAKVAGGNFNLTASEWNAFTSKINEMRNYYGLSSYSFTTAYPNNTFTATMYRQARTAIRAIDGYGTYIPYVYSGDNITAEQMNVLVSELNAIP